MDIQEILSQAVGYLKALICAFSQNEVFPHAYVETRDKVKERKTGGWNHRKVQSESERTKDKPL